MTAPTTEPITLAEAKAQCRVEDTASDTFISGLITTVRQQLEGRDGWLGQALATATWDYKLDTFPAGALELPLPPLASVTSVTYRDGDGPHVWSSANYTVTGVGSGAPGKITPVEGASWPGVDGQPEAVIVRFVAGVDPGAIPEPVKSGIKLLVEDLYDRPEDSILRDRAMSLLRPYRMVTFV